MFEKTLHDLIRGLRNQKGQEYDYILQNLQESRREIKNQDTGIKAVALLKLTYLEMLGHDISWASFHILEVMSSPKLYQKRIGYLAAVQTFQPTTDVLLLAENQLQKDLLSGSPPVVALTLTAIPHVLNHSIACSLTNPVSALLNSSDPSICKKAVVAVYQMALLYPDALRPAWPKMKSRLMSESEDSAVVAAIVNVICELGWRRPRDFLALSPRLFDILVRGRNNWMAIKIVKLFSSLARIETRLAKKLLPALTKIITTTPAMSLLYECINGIIEGGLLESVRGTQEGDEVGRLCLDKLGSMLDTCRDPNLRFVALLAFKRIAVTNPDLISDYADIIVAALDDDDISIQMSAIELCKHFTGAETVSSITMKLLAQLLDVSDERLWALFEQARSKQGYLRYTLDLEPSEGKTKDSSSYSSSHSVEYRRLSISSIIQFCSRDNYSNIEDFEWYLQVLACLSRLCPPALAGLSEAELHRSTGDVSFDVGRQLTNLGIRVPGIRQEVIVLAEGAVKHTSRSRFLPTAVNGGEGVVEGAGFLVGEYAALLSDPLGVLNSLADTSAIGSCPSLVLSFIQSIQKVFSLLCSRAVQALSQVSLYSIRTSLGKMLDFFAAFKNHHNLEVQERALQSWELFSVVKNALSQNEESIQGSVLLSQVLPQLFGSTKLNPIAPAALSKVPLPAKALPYINPLSALGDGRDRPMLWDQSESDRFLSFYYTPNTRRTYRVTKTAGLGRYQSEAQANSRSADPFYLDSGAKGGHTDRASSPSPAPLHSIINSGNNANEFDIDDIPAIRMEVAAAHRAGPRRSGATTAAAGRSSRGAYKVIAEETVDWKLQDDGIGEEQLGLAYPAGDQAAGVSEDGGGAGVHRTILPLQDEERQALLEVERARKQMKLAAFRSEDLSSQARVEPVKIKMKLRAKTGRSLVLDGPGGRAGGQGGGG